MEISSLKVSAYIQARMSSRRFPGKVLAPFRGRPVIDHVIAAVRAAVPGVPVVLLTSTEPSDSPLATYVQSGGTTVFRGALEDVLGRFAACLAASPVDGVLRICADSPLLDGAVLRAVVAAAERTPGVDLVTTIAPRTFPKGQNAEWISARALAAIPAAETTAADREHVTAFLHRHPERFRILNVESGQPELAAQSYAIDTVEDLLRLEGLGAAGAAA